MTARALLVRGLLVGLLAGFASFLVAHQVGEPHVESAIALEAGAAAEGHHDGPAATDGHTHSGDEDAVVVSRGDQRTWGLLTGSLAVGTALGGLAALAAAAAVGRLGWMTPGQSTATVALVGFVSFALVPFLKYPANPPAVGGAETIGARTWQYFAFLLVSVVAAIAGTVLARRLWARLGTYAAVVTAVAAYLAVVVAAGLLLPTVNELGDFPADVLWYFRRASILTLATTWAVIGVGLTGLVGRLYRRDVAVAERRALAASL